MGGTMGEHDDQYAATVWYQGLKYMWFSSSRPDVQSLHQDIAGLLYLVVDHFLLVKEQGLLADGTLTILSARDIQDMVVGVSITLTVAALNPAASDPTSSLKCLPWVETYLEPSRYFTVQLSDIALDDLQRISSSPELHMLLFRIGGDATAAHEFQLAPCS